MTLELFWQVTKCAERAMQIVFCCDPLDTRSPDDAYRPEAEAAERLGIPYSLVSFEALVNEGEPQRAVRRVPQQAGPVLALYRGWMLTPDAYRLLYEALLAKGLRLLNDPAAYRHCHYLPESYPVIEGHTPKSVWTEVDMDRVMERLGPFGPSPVVVKDYVKSQKHAWDEACFIPSASDRAAVERVVRRFLELQGPDLAGGLVFREFVEFEPVGQHPKSGMPLTREYRMFFLNGRPLLCSEYWEEGDYGREGPPVEHFTRIAAGVKSCFFTMDVAKRKGGGWMVVELGDGQVAGLPERADVEAFYRGMAACLGRAG
jgi:hypothetical protein